MDGNGRWAELRKKPRSSGHREGLRTAKTLVKAALDLGIKVLSLYAFSTENWKRTGEEVAFLMDLIGRHLKKEEKFYRENRIRVVHSGDPAGLPERVAGDLGDIRRLTAAYDGLTVNLAINYGGRDEIVRGVNRWLKGREGGESLTEEALSRCLDLPDLPEPDLIIRTGGESRLSNFLLWGSAYAELYFSDKLWPDWTRSDLEEALKFYAARDRKFGGLK
jgi:undecaprenyl diphosphate synthase